MPPAQRAFVYVSNADDGDIGLYALQDGGALEARGRFKAGPAVMPMAVSPDKRFLVAALRSQPFSACTYAIDRASGKLELAGTGPLADSYPYISFDRTGRYLLGASYGGNSVGVNPVGADGKVGAPLQTVPTARNAHSIVIDRSNRYVFVPHLGTDQVLQFKFDEKTGRLAANTPPLVQLAQGSGPRHIVVSGDNRFLYLLNELTATVTTLSLDSGTGLLTPVGSVSSLPPDCNLKPGRPRGPGGMPGAYATAHDPSNDIWASDLHLTPDGRFLYAAERTNATINAMSVDASSGKLKYLSSVATEKQPRGFAIDPGGRYLVVSGEKSDKLATYAIDAASGALEPVGRTPTGRGSNWVEIVSF